MGDAALTREEIDNWERLFSAPWRMWLARGGSQRPQRAQSSLDSMRGDREANMVGRC